MPAKPFTLEEYDILRSALSVLMEDHKDAEMQAFSRATDSEYEYRKEALEAANFHAEYRNKISLLNTKVWHAKADLVNTTLERDLQDGVLFLEV